jgi:hypothetical protein
MYDQLLHLAEVSQHAHVTIQILPFQAGEHAGLDGPFTIIRFPDVNDLDMVYLEHTKKDSYLEDEASVRQYAEIFDHLRASALKSNDSVKLMEIVAEELKAN